MFTRILFLALAIQASLADPLLNAPVLDALAAHHNIASVDHSYTEGLQQALGGNVAVHNEPIHFKTGYVGTLSRPMGTGQIIGKHVETFALGQQAAQVQAQAKVAQVVSHPVQTQTQVMHQSVQVPVQTMQTVQVPSVSYQTVQVPVHIQKEIVEVEKPVPVPQPVAVESPPKPYVKEAVYARPFQKSQKYVKTRITPLEEVTQKFTLDIATPAPVTTTTTETAILGHHVDLTEENLYFANKKRKIVTRFIKIEEMYEAESFEEVGIFYDYGPTSEDDFELKVTRIFEVDQPILVKNETVTSRVTYLRSPTHVVNEYMNGKLEHSYHAGNPHGFLNGMNASADHFHRFHSYGGSSFVFSPSYGAKSPDYRKYTQFMNGREVEIEERTTVLPGGHAIFIEKRIRTLGDLSPFPESLEAVPSFETTIQNGKEVLVFTLTYDSTRKLTHTKYGIAAPQSFGSEFSGFLNEFKKYIPSTGAVYNRLRRSVEQTQHDIHHRSRRDVNAQDDKKTLVKRDFGFKDDDKTRKTRDFGFKDDDKTRKTRDFGFKDDDKTRKTRDFGFKDDDKTRKTRDFGFKDDDKTRKTIVKRGIFKDDDKTRKTRDFGFKDDDKTRKTRDFGFKDDDKTRKTVVKRAPLNQIEYHNKIYKLKTVLPLRGLNPGGYIYRSDDGHEIKVEEETITNIEGGPKNEYLRYSQVYVPRQKVKYEVSGLFGQSADAFGLSGLGSFYNNFQSYPLYNNFFEQGSSYKINNPFYSI